MPPAADLTIATPELLKDARIMAHNAAQIAALAALANIPARPDYSHTALHWEAASGGFQTGVMDSADGPVLIRVTLAPLAMWLVRGGETVDMIALNDTDEADCLGWLDVGLTERGLRAASGVKHPFKLPADVVAITRFKTAGLETGLQLLARWYDLANHQLLTFAAKHSNITPGPSPVYCWPHHFDIATYVSLDAEGTKNARGIGTGLSPGDQNYGEPYIYINPWPHLDASALPQLPAPGHWHTDGFVGAIATASELVTLTDMEAGLAEFIEGSFSLGRTALEG
ncbi:MAG: hypothetical protein NXI27_16150 [Alphaproteobacteria bacterium]|nr:hypothetical protein [Alphaproteobacteria bacterium]